MVDINLLPWRELKREHEKNAFKCLLLLTLLFAVLVLFLMNVYAKTLVDVQLGRRIKLQEEINSFDKDIASIKRLQAVKSELISTMRIIQALQAKRVLTVHLFDELLKVLPDTIYLTEFKRKNNSVMLTGYATSNTSISRLMLNIQKNRWIHNPVLAEIKKNNDADTLVTNQFSLRFSLKFNGDYS